MTEDRSWIKPGAQVVIYSHTHGGGVPQPERRKVDRVAAKSFTVDGVKERIYLDTLKSKDQGDSWHHWRWVVLHPDSEEAARLFEEKRSDGLRRKARHYAEGWLKGRCDFSLEDTDKAIAALTEWRSVLASKLGVGGAP